MNTRRPLCWLWLTLAAVFLALLSIVITAGMQVPGGASKPDVKTTGGLTVVTFAVDPGKITVKLPDDVRAGDTISGTVTTEPKGNTAEEKAKSQKELNGYVLDLEGTKVQADRPRFVWTTNFSQPGKSVRYELKIVEVLGRQIPTTAGGAIIAPDPGMAQLNITQSGAVITPDPRISPRFNIPSLGQTGRPIVITGPFDGDSSNTSLNWTAIRSSVQDFEKNRENVSGGFGLIAESPRKAIFEAPSNVAGPIELHLTEGKTQTTGNYRNVGVNLSAPKTSLTKGESTTLTVEVNGLQGLTQPVPLTLESHGVITMEGGVYQPLVIQPSQVGPDGRYTTTRGITGVETGGWTAAGTVVTQRFNFCLQDDSRPQTVILINTFTGDYIFPQASGANLGGNGAITRKDCIFTLTDNRPDRRVQSKIDPCTQTGSASVQASPPNSPKVKFTITDRNTTDNTCACGPGCN